MESSTTEERVFVFLYAFVNQLQNFQSLQLKGQRGHNPFYLHPCI